MNLITRVWAALGSLAGNLEALSATVAEANANARGNLGLPSITPPALTDAAATTEETRKPRGGNNKSAA